MLVGRSNNVGSRRSGSGSPATRPSRRATSSRSDAGRLLEHTRRADILVVAAGIPKLVTGEMVKDGVIVVDVGINPDARPGDRQDAARRRRRLRQRRRAAPRRSRPCPAASDRSPTSGCCATRSGQRGSSATAELRVVPGRSRPSRTLAATHHDPWTASGEPSEDGSPDLANGRSGCHTWRVAPLRRSRSGRTCAR